MSRNELSEIPTLPLDVLVHIFEYIDDFNDLKNFTLVCKDWLEATQISKILKHFKLCFSFVTIDCAANKQPLALFTNSNRVFSNIFFENTKFNYIDPAFWSQWSDTITEITFAYKHATADLPGGNFLELLKYTPKLKTLTLVCSLDLFNKLADELSAVDRKIVFDNIKNVQELQLYFTEVCLEKIEFNSWMDDLTKLKNIDFDVHSKNKSIPERAYSKIFEFLDKNGSKIKGLRICDNNRAINRSVIQRLLEIKNMKLKALDLTINSSSTKLFTDFLCSQSELLYLTVSGIFSLLTTLPKMPKLKEIVISNGPSLDGFKVFNSIKKLESLAIAGLEFSDPNEKNLEHQNYKLEKNPKLKELYLIDGSNDFTPQLTQSLCECFENIRLLNLDGAMIDDSSLYYIFRLKKLQELKLSNTIITDNGILGDFGSYSSKKKRKKSEPTEHSIALLKNLEVLNIDFCKRLTTRSFQSLVFGKLKHLSAQGCNVRQPDFLAFGKNCPMLESVNFSLCHQIREADINILTSKLYELETLELKSCARIDSGCMQQIMSNCRKLQTLDVTNCNFDVKAVAKQMFEAVKSLRRIILRKEQLYRCNYVM